jgi:hypothetical protein
VRSPAAAYVDQSRRATTRRCFTGPRAARPNPVTAAATLGYAAGRTDPRKSLVAKHVGHNIIEVKRLKGQILREALNSPGKHCSLSLEKAHHGLPTQVLMKRDTVHPVLEHVSFRQREMRRPRTNGRLAVLGFQRRIPSFTRRCGTRSDLGGSVQMEDVANPPELRWLSLSVDKAEGEGE